MKPLWTLAISLVAVSQSFGQDLAKLQGKPIPPLSMNLFKGGKLSVASLRGKVVILDFWATWCVPCVAASPTMQKLYGKYKNHGLIIVGSDFNDTPDKITDYEKKHGYSYPVTVHNEAIAKGLGIEAIPVFIFIDKKGIVRRVDTGFNSGSSPASWEATVKQLLAG